MPTIDMSKFELMRRWKTFDPYLRLYLPCMELSGIQTLDYSGYNNHGTPNVGIKFGVPGRFYNTTSARFNGLNDGYINCGNNLSLNDGSNATKLTLEAWINTDTISGTGGIINKGRDAADLFKLYRNTNDITFEINDDNGAAYAIVTFLDVLNTFKWYHVVGTWDFSKRYYRRQAIAKTDTRSSC